MQFNISSDQLESSNEIFQFYYLLTDAQISGERINNSMTSELRQLNRSKVNVTIDY